MKTKFKRVLLNFLLVLVILILLLLFHAGFIAGPIRVKEHEDKLFVEAFATQMKLKDVELLDRFVLDEVYYVVRSKDKMYWFNKDFSRYGEQDFISKEGVLEEFDDLGYDVGYGVYDDQIVFTFEKSVHYVFLDVETLEKVFEFGGSDNVVE